MRLPLPRLLPGERRPAVGAFSTLLVLMTGHGIMETARDAIFLGALGARELPLVYLAVAAVALALTFLQRALAGGRSGAGSLVVALIAASLGTILLWLGLPVLGRSGPFLVYLWSAGGTTFAFVQFWSVVGGLFTVTQAKRLYAGIGVGAVFGALVGSGIAALLSSWVPPRHLMPVAALAWAGAAVLASRTLGGGAGDAPSAGRDRLRDGLRLVGGDPYLRQLLRLALVGAIALTLADFVFKSVVVDRVPAEQLAPFFARLYFAIYAGSLLVQLLAVGRLVRGIGVVAASLILPAVLALGTTGVLLGAGGLAGALALKAGDGLLRHTVHGTASELLFVPLTTLTRARSKPIISILGQRGGQAVASLAVLILIAVGAAPRQIAMLLAAVLVWWAWVALGLRGPYLDVFRRTLASLSSGSATALPAADQGSIEGLFERLSSADDGVVLTSLELLGEAGKARLVPALLLFHPSDRVVIAAAEQFGAAGRTDFAPIADRILGTASAEVHAALVLARGRVDVDPAFLRRMLGSTCPGSRGAALASLVQRGDLSGAEAAPLLDALLDDGDPRALHPLARAARSGSTPLLDDALVRLTASTDRDLRRAAVEAMAALADPRFCSTLIFSLGDRAVRAPCLRAFERLGAPALSELEDALGDESLPPVVRWEIPRAVARVAAPPAASILARRLVVERDRVVTRRVVDALAHLVRRGAAEGLPLGTLDEATDRVERDLRSLLDEADAVSTPGQRGEPERHILERVLRGRAEGGLGVLLRLVGLRVGDDFERIVRGLRSASPVLRASGLELLENLVPPPRRGRLIGLIDRVQAPPHAVDPSLAGAALAALLRSDSRSLRELAASYAGALGASDAS